MVILAPVCEEILFRGFIQSAYESRSKKYGFVIAALIFGAYHILNGISEVIPASILGLCMGFLVYKTGSLASSMLFHATANICAILFGGVLIINMQGSNLVWLCAVAVAGAFISVALLRSVKEEARSDENGEEANNGSKISAAGILFLVLSAVYLVTIGVLEIMSR
jgi:membrane protease YdiL (CAAX protease family)